MQDFILSVSWAATAFCFAVGFLVMFVTAATGGIWAVLKLKYLLELEAKKMQFECERKIGEASEESLMWTRRSK